MLSEVSGTWYISLLEAHTGGTGSEGTIYETLKIKCGKEIPKNKRRGVNYITSDRRAKQST